MKMTTLKTVMAAVALSSFPLWYEWHANQPARREAAVLKQQYLAAKADFSLLEK